MSGSRCQRLGPGATLQGGRAGTVRTAELSVGPTAPSFVLCGWPVSDPNLNSGRSRAGEVPRPSRALWASWGGGLGLSNAYFAVPDCRRSPVVGPGHRAACHFPQRPWAVAGGPAWPALQPSVAGSEPGDLGWSRGAGRGAARALRLGGRDPGAGAGDAEVPGGREAQLRESAARPRRPACAPGRSHAGAPETGRSRPPALLSAPSGHLPAAGGGQRHGGRAGGVRVRLRQAPELRWRRGGGGGRPLQGVPLGSGGLQGASYVWISVGCLAPAAFVPRAPGEPGEPGGGVPPPGGPARLCSASVSPSQGWRAPGRPTAVWLGS